MKVNPKNGQFTLSEFGNRALIPKMTIADYLHLGFKLGNPDDASAQAQINQKTFSFLSVQFQDAKLKRVTIGFNSSDVKDELKALGIKPQAYDWGVVTLESHAQSGETWLEIRYS